MERKGKAREEKGKERKGKERKGKERKGKEGKGKERKGKERKGKERSHISGARPPELKGQGLGLLPSKGNAQAAQGWYTSPNENRLPQWCNFWALPVLFPVYVRRPSGCCPVPRWH